MSGLNGWRPGLVALDVDGTIVTYESYLDPLPRPRVLQALRDASQAGANIVLATGRTMLSASRLAERFGLTGGYAVCSNGAVVIDVPTGKVVHLETFDVSDPVRYFAETIPDAILAVEELGRGFRVTGEFPTGELDGVVTVVSHDELIEQPVTRLVVHWPNGDRDRLRRFAAASGLSSVDYAIGKTAWLDIMPKGVSKASALSHVAGLMGLSNADTLAVGDGHNDVEMLRWARWGVAMGQAPDDVKAIADDVCGEVGQDGLAAVLDDFFR